MQISIQETTVGQIGRWSVGVSNIWEDADDNVLRATLAFWNDTDDGENFRVAQGERIRYQELQLAVEMIHEGLQLGSVTLSQII